VRRAAPVSRIEQPATPFDTTSTTTAPARPDVTFYYEGSIGIGPEAEAALDDGTWKVGFRTSRTAPGLRVRFLAQTKNGPGEFTADFSDPRPMYNLTAVGRIDAALLELPANPPRQGGSPIVFQKILAVEWDGGSQTF
jgi:hypothetical protein